MGLCPAAPFGLGSPGYGKKRKGSSGSLDLCAPTGSNGVRYSRDAMTAKEEGPPTVAGFLFAAGSCLP